MDTLNKYNYEFSDIWFAVIFGLTLVFIIIVLHIMVEKKREKQRKERMQFRMKYPNEGDQWKRL